MKNLLSLVFLFTISAHADVSPAPAAIEGRQLEEKLIRWVWTHRQSLLFSCIHDQATCGGKKEFQSYFEKMQSILDSEAPLQFYSEKERPDLFKSTANETHRAAVTGSQPKSEIDFNRDRISNVELSTLVGILFHEFSHHLGIADDSTRVPDQIGALVAEHFRRQTQTMTAALDELNHPEIRVTIFQQVRRELYFFADRKWQPFNFSFFTDGKDVLDVDLSQFTIVPPCKKSGDVIFTQISATPVWTVGSKDKDGRYPIRMVSGIQNLCGVDRSKDATLVDKSYKLIFDLTPAGLVDWSSLTSYVADPGYEDYVDALRTIKLLEYHFSSETVAAGGRLQVSARLQRLKKNSVPKSCVVTIFSPSWPMQSEFLHVQQGFQNCTLTTDSNGDLQIQAFLEVPALMAPGTYNLSMIQIRSDGDPAILKMPPDAIFQVQNSTFKELPKITSVGFPGLKPIANIGTQAFLNSVMYSTGQTFEIVVDVKSNSQPLREAFGFGVLVRGDNELKVVGYFAEIADLAFLIQNRRVTKTDQGYQIHYQVQIPRQLQNQDVFGLWVQRVLVQDESFNWFSIEYPAYDHMIMLDKLVEVNH